MRPVESISYVLWNNIVAGTYESVSFVASDGVAEVSINTTFLIAQGNQAPTLLPVSDRTFLEGDAIRVQLQASDTEDDPLLLPKFSRYAIPKMMMLLSLLLVWA